MSPTIGSGHDSRKLILYNLPHVWTIADIHKTYSKIGNVMHISMPLDYERGPIIEADQELFDEIMGPQNLRLSDVDMTGPPNVFQDFRRYVLKEITRLKFVIPCKINNSAQIFSDICGLWQKILKFKDCLTLEETAAEQKLSNDLNSLINTETNFKLKPRLENILSKLEVEFNTMIDQFFPHKGYARVQFATREQAERAILMSTTVFYEYYDVQAVFDRDLPGFYYSSLYIAQARLQNFHKYSISLDRKKELEVKINHHFTNLVTHLTKKIERPTILNDSNYADPLISHLARSKGEAKDIISKIEGISNYGTKKREDKLFKKFKHPNTLLFSSDDEYFVEKKPENNTPAFEQINDTRQDYTRKLANEFLMFPEKIPTRKEDVSLLHIVPEMEFPREFPPVKMWTEPGERTKAYENLLNYEQFFHETVPKDLKSDLNKLHKEKFGDFPNFRYVYDPEHEHQRTKVEDKNKRREMLAKIREKISNINQETPEINPQLNYVELGSEEYTILTSKKEMRINTDSEEEEMKLAEIKKHEGEDIYDKIVSFKNKMESIQRFNTELNGIDIDDSITKSFRYEGKDVEAYVKELNQKKNYQADYRYNDFKEPIVHVTCTREKDINFEQVSNFVKKYDKVFSKYSEEVEIDEEDLPLMEKIKSFENEPNEIFIQLLNDAVKKKYTESFNEYTSTEPIYKYGQMTPMVQDEEEKEEAYSEIYGVRDIHDKS